MSVTVSLPNLSVTNIGSCNVGTVTPETNSSIKASSTAFVVNLTNYLNLIINKVNNIYTASGIKTFVALYLTGGTTTDPIKIGSSNASIVNILPTSSTISTHTISFNGTNSGLQSNFSGNTFTSPVVTPNVYNKIICGINTATTTTAGGTAYTFVGLGYQSFSTGCTPIFLTTGTNATARNVGAGNVTNTSFVLISPNITQSVSWVAIGY
jgi:hypothetical protein